jgi:hypothetical protein
MDSRALTGGQITEWHQGQHVEAGWGILANHGGGYSYALCRKPATFPTKRYADLTEECFQQQKLRFVGDVQWIQSAEPNMNNRTEIRAIRTTNGTFPPGSQWTRNPVPACITRADGGGGARQPCIGPQFPPPIPNLYGWFGVNLATWSKPFFPGPGAYASPLTKLLRRGYLVLPPTLES